MRLDRPDFCFLQWRKDLNPERRDAKIAQPFALAALSIAVGAFTGLVAAMFRLLLHSADGWRTYFISRP
jgi:hypothetical protein